mmetsp:Transcript_85783/g.188337  ORF Transcript_85783/g.188337 Transcript_85783/m.188337 type:complete len:378 (+) Transcript_85783:467-1600(+)
MKVKTLPAITTKKKMKSTQPSIPQRSVGGSPFIESIKLPTASSSNSSQSATSSSESSRPSSSSSLSLNFPSNLRFFHKSCLPARAHAFWWIFALYLESKLDFKKASFCFRRSSRSLSYCLSFASSIAVFDFDFFAALSFRFRRLAPPGEPPLMLLLLVLLLLLLSPPSPPSSSGFSLPFQRRCTAGAGLEGILGRLSSSSFSEASSFVSPPPPPSSPVSAKIVAKTFCKSAFSGIHPLFSESSNSAPNWVHMYRTYDRCLKSRTSCGVSSSPFSAFRKPTASASSLFFFSCAMRRFSSFSLAGELSPAGLELSRSDSSSPLACSGHGSPVRSRQKEGRLGSCRMSSAAGLRGRNSSSDSTSTSSSNSSSSKYSSSTS